MYSSVSHYPSPSLLLDIIHRLNLLSVLAFFHLFCTLFLGTGHLECQLSVCQAFGQVPKVAACDSNPPGPYLYLICYIRCLVVDRAFAGQAWGPKLSFPCSEKAFLRVCKQVYSLVSSLQAFCQRCREVKLALTSLIPQASLFRTYMCS